MAVQDEGRPLVTDLDFGLEAGQGGLVVASSAPLARDLMRTWATLRPPAGGELKLFGQGVLWSAPDRLLDLKRRIGWVHRRSSLVSNMTILDNVILGMIYHRNIRRKVAEEEVKDLLDRFGLYHHRNRRPAELSFHRQRMAVHVRELAKNPKLILLEDPVVDLDDDFPALMREVKDRARAREAAFLVADINLIQVLSWVDLVLVVDEKDQRTYASVQFDPALHIPFPLGRGVARPMEQTS
jgi:ABC-type polar amino acid transport system ATPase subunit